MGGTLCDFPVRPDPCPGSVQVDTRFSRTNALFNEKGHGMPSIRWSRNICSLTTVKSFPQCEGFYFPMHGVAKEMSTTTKLSVVFDASAKTHSMHSLNGMLVDVSIIFQEVVLDPSERDFNHFLAQHKLNLWSAG